MTNQGFKESGHPMLGREYPPDGEVGYVTKMISQIREQLRSMYTEGETKRQAHPKMHGLVRAKFRIEPGLPPEYLVGVFAKPGEYDCWIRYSNNNTHPQPDKKGDVRGMAIKLVGVSGDKLLPDLQTAQTQDFLLISTETFMAATVKEFSRAIRAVTSDSKISVLLFALSPRNWPQIFRTIKAFIKVGSVLDIPYYSTVPYQFGSQDKAVKYMCIPVNPVESGVPKKPDDDFLRYRMIETLGKGYKEFDFCVQFQENATTMPIENPTKAWSSRPVKLATVFIPAQDFDNEDQVNYGEILSFNPWHSLPEHRPLGGLNRARRLIYENISQFRHKQSNDPMFEPDNMDIPGAIAPSPSPAPSPTPKPTMTNTDIIKQLYACYAKGDIAGVLAAMHPDIVWIEPGYPAVPYSGVFKGIDGIKEMLGKEHEMLKVQSFTPISFLSNDTQVAVLGTDTTQVISTGKVYTTSWVQAFTLSNSLITHVEVYMDTEAVAAAFKAG